MDAIFARATALDSTYQITQLATRARAERDRSRQLERSAASYWRTGTTGTDPGFRGHLAALTTIVALSTSRRRGRRLALRLNKRVSRILATEPHGHEIVQTLKGRLRLGAIMTNLTTGARD